MQCYKCHTKMKKKAVQGVLIDFCDVCEGIWLDGGELEQLKNNEGKSIEELKAEGRREIASEKKRLVTSMTTCPRCQSQRLQEKIFDGVELDICSSCGGMYFDWGELNRVMNSQSNEANGFMSFIGKVRGKFGLK